MEAVLRSSMSNTHGSPDEKDSPTGQHSRSSEHHGSAGKGSPHRTMVENWGISSSCYHLLMNIFLLYLLSFSNTAFKNLFRMSHHSGQKYSLQLKESLFKILLKLCISEIPTSLETLSFTCFSDRGKITSGSISF